MRGPLITITLAAFAGACSVPDPFDPLSPAQLCKESRNLTRQHYDQMEFDEATSFKRWFWVEAPFKGQKAQKGAVYVDKETGFILLAPAKGKIGAWVSVSALDTIRDGHDRWGCEVTYLIKAAVPDQSIISRIRTYSGEYPVRADEPEEVARVVAVEMAKADLQNLLEEYGAEVEMQLNSIVEVDCNFIEHGWAPVLGQPKMLWWPAIAGKKPLYEDAAHAAREAFWYLAIAGKHRVPLDSGGIKTTHASEMRAAWEAEAQKACAVDDRPARAEDPPAAPPGATPPDRGGIDVPPGSTPGNGDEGDK
ncbi:hypothetical protein [Sorangium sp. So ce388]|uniref:hypothetical protein n=1 Tax=Sorangium sp. So ce388 TaxID=3133309 RepID=UPI003F5C4F36